MRPLSTPAHDSARARVGFLCVIASTILWGTSATLARWTMKHDVPPLTVVELRLAISVLLLAVGFALVRPALFRIARADVIPLIILGSGGVPGAPGAHYSTLPSVGCRSG